LRAGEALSSVLLTATRAGLATTPLSQATEVAASRELLRQALGIPEQPQLVLRSAGPQPTPRSCRTHPGAISRPS
jgi:hypothetical protein